MNILELSRASFAVDNHFPGLMHYLCICVGINTSDSSAPPREVCDANAMASAP